VGGTHCVSWRRGRGAWGIKSLFVEWRGEVRQSDWSALVNGRKDEPFSRKLRPISSPPRGVCSLTLIVDVDDDDGGGGDAEGLSGRAMSKGRDGWPRPPRARTGGRGGSRKGVAATDLWQYPANAVAQTKWPVLWRGEKFLTRRP